MLTSHQGLNIELLPERAVFLPESAPTNARAPLFADAADADACED